MCTGLGDIGFEHGEVEVGLVCAGNQGKHDNVDLLRTMTRVA